MIIGIYKILSPTGRVYIGQSVNINKRFGEYKRLRNLKSQIKLYRSLVKHGVENHLFEIIEECLEEDLNCRERYWQDFYDVLNGGLNCVLQECGEQRKVFSEEIKTKIGNKNRGKVRTQEMKDKMSKAQKGKTLTEEHKSKISRKGELSPSYGKKGFDSNKGKLTIHKTLYIVYGSARYLCELLNGEYNYNYFRSMLNGNDKNTTPYQYLEDFLDDNPNFDTSILTFHS